MHLNMQFIPLKPRIILHQEIKVCQIVRDARGKQVNVLSVCDRNALQVMVFVVIDSSN